MSKNLRTEAVDHLFDAILCLENREECYTFFEDVCTINEILSLSQRFEVAKMLREQKTYLDIAEKTGASTATISRVNRSLNYGNDGYDLVKDDGTTAPGWCDMGGNLATGAIPAAQGFWTKGVTGAFTLTFTR